VLTEDYGVLFNTEGFAIPATYTPLVGSPYPINVIFDNEYVSDGDIETVSPSLTAPLTYFTSPPERGDLTLIEGDNYEVVDLQPDGLGIIRLRLEIQ